MKLSSGRTGIDLTPLAYEFPAAPPSPPGDRSWDCNWIVVRGVVTTPKGAWQFEDACMTTWEAHNLAAWLRLVGAGDVAVEPFDTADPDRLWYAEPRGLLMFTEPTVAFSVAAYDAEAVTLRVHLSLAGRAPWDVDGPSVEVFEDFFLLSVDRTAITVAADIWERELHAFPER